MPICGDKNKFAIEYEYATNKEIFFQIWCKGISIGDFSKPIHLATCIFQFRDFLSHKERQILRFTDWRNHINYDKDASSENIFYFLYDRIMPYQLDITEERRVELDKKLATFHNCYLEDDVIQAIFHMDKVGGESFKNIGIIYLRDSWFTLRGWRIIWRDFTDMSLHEVEFNDDDRTIFHLIAEEFINAIEEKV